MKYIGRYGEYIVLSSLLKRDVEAYLAIKTNQDDYDITVINSKNKILRIQVKTTELNNKSTNNSISGTDKKYDFLILVIVSSCNEIYILPKDDVERIKGQSKQLGTTFQKNGTFEVKEEIKLFKDKWELIENA